MNKKRIFGIVLFFLLGFFVFTFANPKDDNEDMNNNDILKPTPEVTENQRVNNSQEQQASVQPDSNVQEQQASVQPAVNNQGQQSVAQPTTNNQGSNNNGGTSNQVAPVVNPEPVETDEPSEQVEDLTDYRNAAKKEITDYRDSLKLITSTDSIIKDANNQIDNATTKEAIDKVVNDTKNLLDEVKAAELAGAKELAIKELNEYKKDYDYSEKSKEVRSDIIDEYTNKINEATTINEVIESLKEGKEAIDKLIAEDLAEYKKQAKEEIVEYRDSLDLITSTESIIEEANNQIDNSTTKKEIDKVVSDTKDLLDKVKAAELAGAKELAIKELNEYKKDYDYSEKSKEVRSDIIAEYTDKINEATTIKEVKELLKEGKEAIDKLIAEDLAEYKKQAKEELINYNKDELYSEENLEKVNEIKKDGIDEIDEATTKKEIDEILNTKEEEIDKIQKLTDTYFNVTFVDFYGEKTVVPVLYSKDANAPEMKDVKENGVVYKFDGWDKEFTNIKTNIEVKAIYVVDEISARINLDDEENTSLGSVNLTVTEKLSGIVKENTTTSISEVENNIKEMIAEGETLPVSQKLNYKYTFNTLKYVANEGFYIEASEVIDEEQLAKNTVVLTYVVNGDAAFADGKTTKTVTTYTGSNNVELPEVYRNGKVVNVNWVDSNNELKEVYTKSETLTASLDKTAPVITLNGPVSRELIQTKDAESYVEEGYKVTDATNPELTADDVVVTITKDGSKVNSVSLNVPGTYVITYTVEDAEGNIGSATRTIVVTKAKLVNIQVTKSHGEYFVGDSMEEITVTAHYNNGVKETVTDYTVTGFDTTEPTTGNKTATISYQGQTANYTYKVKAIVVDRIEISKNSGEYFVGDSMEEITVTAYYNNGKSETVTDYTVTGFNTNKPTEKNKKATATISFGGKSKEYKYTVKAVELTDIELSKTSGEYFVGDLMEEIIVTAYYNNGKSETVTDYTVTGFNTNKPTKKNKTASATVSFGGKSKEYKYIVKAIEFTGITLSEENGEYFAGDDMHNIIVTAHYNNGTTKTLCDYYNEYDCYDGYTRDYFYPNWLGTHTMTYYYNGKKATYTYTIKEVVLENITLSKTSGEYYVGDSMENIEVTAHYNNGKTEKVEEMVCYFGCSDGYEKTNFSSANGGNYSVIYSYNGKKATYNYTVKELVATEITLSATTGTYIVGDNMDNINVTVKYNNGKTENVTTKASVTGFDTSKENVGNGKVATISYAGLSVQYTYDVKYHAEIGTKDVKVGHGWNASYQSVYYLSFELPNNASVAKVVRTDANGTSYEVNLSKDGNTYYISETDYTEIKKMKGNNPNQTLVVTYNVGGSAVSSTYTRVIEN